LPSPESMRSFMDDSAPPLGQGKYCVFKPLDQFYGTDKPLSVTFFAGPEVLTGLTALVTYTVGNHNALVSGRKFAVLRLI